MTEADNTVRFYSKSYRLELELYHTLSGVRLSIGNQSVVIPMDIVPQVVDELKKTY